MQADELRDTTALRAAVFAHVSAYVAAVPTYVGGFMAIGIASDRRLSRLSAPELASRAKAGLTGDTSYWSADVHAAAFALPPYIARLLPHQE